MARNLTQQELADRCEIDIRTIERIEKGELNFSNYLFSSIANAFKMTESELFEYIGCHGDK